MAKVAPRMTMAGAAFAIALLFVVPIPQSGTNIVNIVYGRSWPRAIVLDPSRQLAYVDGMSGIYPPDGFSFGVVSLANQTVGTVVGLPGIAGELALDAGSGTVYAAGQNSVSAFSVQNMSFERTIALKIPIFSMAFDSSTGYILLTSGNRIFQMDPESGSLLRNTTVGNSAQGMAVDTASGIVFVANYLSSSVTVLRTSDLTIVRTVQLASTWYPSQIALDTKHAILYVTTDDQSVAEVSSKSYAVIGSLEASKSSANGTYALAIDPTRHRLFVATEPGTTISELNATTGALLATFAVDSAAFEMAVDQTTGKLYVTNYHQITVISPMDVPQPAPQVPQYGTWAVIGGLTIAIAVGLYLWRFNPIGGRRGGPSPQRQTSHSS